MASKQKQKITLSGRNIYQDKRGRNVWYDFLTKKFLYIDESDENKLFIYKNRLAIIVVAVILLYEYLFKTTTGAVIAGAFGLIAFEIYYRLKVFSKMKEAKGITKRDNVSHLETILKTKDKPKIIMLLILYTLLAVLLVVNTFLEDYSTAIILICYLIAAAGAYFAIMHAIALIKYPTK